MVTHIYLLEKNPGILLIAAFDRYTARNARAVETEISDGYL
jgi:hypothetical protein